MEEQKTNSLETENYYKATHFYKAHKQLITASHWVDPETGEQVKLSHNIKAVYFHKLDQYTSFSNNGKDYIESHQRVADILGISYKVVSEVAIPLLKRMGLLYIDHRSARRHVTTVYPLSKVIGKLINPKLESRLQEQIEGVKKEKITYEELQIVERNKKKIEKMKSNLKEEYFILTKEEMDRLRER